MAGLRQAALTLALLSATPARADPVERWRPIIADASRRFGIPTDWIKRVMRAESGGRTSSNGRPIRSAKGAIGVMQLMPATWAEMRATLHLGSDPDDPRDNILAGSFYLRLLCNRFGYPGLFAAYNAGPRRYAEFLTRRRHLPRETLAYLGQVGTGTAQREDRRSASVRGSANTPSPTADALFAVRHAASNSAETSTPARSNRTIFALPGPS